MTVTDRFARLDGTIDKAALCAKYLAERGKRLRGFAQAIQNMPRDGNPASAAAVMGPCYPRAAVCSLSMLEADGPQACLRGS